MIGPSPGTRIWIAAGATDLRRGLDGLAALVQTRLAADPFSGPILAFRGRRGDRIKLLWLSISIQKFPGLGVEDLPVHFQS